MATDEQNEKMEAALICFKDKIYFHAYLAVWNISMRGVEEITPEISCWALAEARSRFNQTPHKTVSAIIEEFHRERRPVHNVYRMCCFCCLHLELLFCFSGVMQAKISRVSKKAWERAEQIMKDDALVTQIRALPGVGFDVMLKASENAKITVDTPPMDKRPLILREAHHDPFCCAIHARQDVFILTLLSNLFFRTIAASCRRTDVEEHQGLSAHAGNLRRHRFVGGRGRRRS